MSKYSWEEIDWGYNDGERAKGRMAYTVKNMANCSDAIVEVAWYRMEHRGIVMLLLALVIAAMKSVTKTTVYMTAQYTVQSPSNTNDQLLWNKLIQQV